jgi:hypothetical protein
MEQEGAGTGRHRAVLLASREEQGRGRKGGRTRACVVRRAARHACARRPGAAACWGVLVAARRKEWGGPLGFGEVVYIPRHVGLDFSF